MINDKHLTIVRAALTFWDEEMSMVDATVYQPYLHTKDHGALLSPAEVAEVRHYFNNIELKVVLLDKKSGTFDSESPISLTGELSYQADRQMLVAILVPSKC